MTGPAVTPPNAAPDIDSVLQRIFSSSNWRSEVEKTVRRYSKLLGEKKRIETELVETTKKLPKDGEKLLTKEQAAEYDAFTALKLKPAEMTALIADHGKLKLKEDERAAEEQYATAADALGFENVPALTRWLKREKLALEFKDTKVEGEDGKKVYVKMPYVRPADNDKAVPEALEEYIDREVPEFVDIFKTAPAKGDDDEDGGRGSNDETGDLIERAGREAADRVRGGVRIPATRSADRGTGASRDKKKLQEIEDSARADPIYTI